MAKILFVEDDADLLERIQTWLETKQHVVELAGNGKQATEMLVHFKYDLVILDLGLPDMSGLDVLRSFRESGGSTPFLILTGRGEMVQKVEGLDAGADDYITKPFDTRELDARIRTLLRRPTELVGAVLTVNGLELDSTAKMAQCNGADLRLRAREFAVLEFLMRHADRVISHDELIARIWHSEADTTSETIHTHIKNLRKKLSAAGSYDVIETVHGAGYVIRTQRDK
jgi:Response regulators consisting of a CheY-like receiver domain and a winged-helix DNA-binding domain